MQKPFHFWPQITPSDVIDGLKHIILSRINMSFQPTRFRQEHGAQGFNAAIHNKTKKEIKPVLDHVTGH
jgi:hypothetical protein